MGESDAVSAADVLRFWFGSGDDREAVRHGRNLWWRGGDRLDSEITRGFRRTVDAAARSMLDGWAEEARGRLALILLLDQFSRHIWRGRSPAYANDPLARNLVREGLRRRHDADLTPMQRAFFYMPLQHSEFLPDQERSVACYRALKADATSDSLEELSGFLEHATAHRNLIARFGRFPHRDEILGRTSTEAEREFMETHGRRFRARGRRNRQVFE